MLLDIGLRRKSALAPFPQTLTLDSPEGWLTGEGGGTVAAAMKVAAVSRCMEIRCGSMAKLPVFVMDETTHTHVPDHYLGKVLWQRPNEAMTPSDYKALVECNRLGLGNGYAWIWRDRGTGRPKELIPLPTACVTPWFDENGRLWYRFVHPKTGETRDLHPMNVLHYKGFSEDGVTGMGVLARAKRAIEVARAKDLYEGSFYRRGGRPSGVLETTADLTAYDREGQPSARAKLRQEWERIYGGPENAFRVAVLDLGTTYKPISVSNADAQFVESKEVSVLDIANFFGVPPHKLGFGKQSYASNEQNALSYITDTLQTTVTGYEEEDTWKLLLGSDIKAGLRIRRNMMAELRGDSKSRGAWYKTMRECGAFSVNDILALEDLPPVPGGDTRYASFNYGPLEDFREMSWARNGKGKRKENG